MENISAEELQRMKNESRDQLVVIDLMNHETFAERHIPDAINIPIDELDQRLSEIPKDKTIVVACARGLMKSDQALEKLMNAGFKNTTKLSRGTLGWFESNPA